MERSYCGTGLHVVVRSSEEPTAKLIVAARFEAAGGPSIQVDDVVSADTITASENNESGPVGQWIRGEKATQELVEPQSDAPDAVSQQRFELNGGMYARWYYDWESGANKSQRSMQHVLKAYVLVCEDDSAKSLRVVATVVSPGFTVISYRRAQATATVAEESEDRVLDRRAPSPVWTQPLNVEAHALTLLRHSNADQLPALTIVKRPRGNYEFPSISPRRVHGAIGSRRLDFTRAMEEQVLWEHSHGANATQAKNLHLLVLFSLWTPLTAYSSDAEGLAQLLHHRTLQSPSQTVWSALMKSVLEQIVPIDTSPPLELPPPSQVLLGVMAEAIDWFFSPQTQRWLQQFIQAHASAVEYKHELRVSFLSLLSELQRRLERDVLSESPFESLDRVAEQILAVVYSQELYAAKRPYVRSVLGSSGFEGGAWRAFVAQMGEAFASSNACRAAKRSKVSTSSSPASLPVLRAIEADWNGQWVLKADVSEIDGQWAKSSIAMLMAGLSEIARPHVHIDIQAQCLWLSHGAADSKQGMQLILDGRRRALRQLPCGLAASLLLAPDAMYAGVMELQPPEATEQQPVQQLAIRLELSNARSQRQTLSLRLWGHGRSLLVDGPMLRLQYDRSD